jgi:hypothetical protein
MRGRGSPLRTATASLLVALAGVTAPLLVAPTEAGAQGGLCEMRVFPISGGFSLGPHTVTVRMTCGELPEGSSHYSYEELRITSSAAIAEFASLEVGTCTVGDLQADVECPLLLGDTAQTQELHGDLRFVLPTCSGGTSLGAEVLMEGDDGSREWFGMPVKGPCVGQEDFPAPTVDKGCNRSDFKAILRTPPDLRAWLLDAVTFGGEVSDEVPQYLVTLGRQGKKVAKEPRLPALKYESNLTSFKVKIPAGRLARGKYLVRFFLELNSPDDYPSTNLRFKVC